MFLAILCAQSITDQSAHNVNYFKYQKLIYIRGFKTGKLHEVLNLLYYEKFKYRHRRMYLISAILCFAFSIRDNPLKQECENELSELRIRKDRSHTCE